MRQFLATSSVVQIPVYVSLNMRYQAIMLLLLLDSDTRHTYIYMYNKKHTSKLLLQYNLYVQISFYPILFNVSLSNLGVRVIEHQPIFRTQHVVLSEWARN